MPVESLQRWALILPLLEEFQRHLAQDIAPLEIEAANDIRWSNDRYLQQCKTGIFRKYGVYLIFTADESLDYVGLAMNAFNDRIWSHDDHVDRCWTDLIAFPHEHYFLAPALEFFLISHLKPPKNKVYSDYTIQASAMKDELCDR